MTNWIVVKSQILNTDKNLDMCFREICFVYTLELQVVKSSSKRCTWRNQHVNILQNINTYPRNMLGRELVLILDEKALRIKLSSII